MPKPLPTIDPQAFAARLNAALDTRPDLYPDGRGRNKALATAFKVSQPTASAWLNGEHMPSVDRVLALAIELNQDFMSLYFGDHLAVSGNGATGKVSPPVRWTADTLQDAMGLLDELDAIAGRAKAPRPNPARLLIACEVVSEGGIVDGKSNVVRLSERLRAWEANNGNESGKAA